MLTHQPPGKPLVLHAFEVCVPDVGPEQAAQDIRVEDPALRLEANELVECRVVIADDVVADDALGILQLLDTYRYGQGDRVEAEVFLFLGVVIVDAVDFGDFVKQAIGLYIKYLYDGLSFVVLDR